MAVLPWNWFRYAKDKLEYSKTLARKSYPEGGKRYWYKVYKSMTRERMTMWTEFEDNHYMPIFGLKVTLLVRKIPEPNPQILRVGDVVLHKDPTDLDNLLIRRIAAFKGCDMTPTVPFTLDKDECWVLTDNLRIDAKDAHDSRTFGPLYMPHILGRPIFKFNEWGPGPVWNSQISQLEDEAVIDVELEYYINKAKEEKEKEKEDDDDDEYYDDDDDGEYYDDDDDDETK